MIIDHRIVHWDIIDKPINPRHVPTGAGLNPLIQSLEVTVGDSFGLFYGFLENGITVDTGAISPESTLLADGSSVAVDGAYSAGATNVIFRTASSRPNTDLADFKELVIYDGATELVTLQRSAATFNVDVETRSVWSWTVAVNYFGTTVGATRTIELRR